MSASNSAASDCPLAVCDHRTVGDDEGVPNVLHIVDRMPEGEQMFAPMNDADQPAARADSGIDDGDDDAVVRQVLHGAHEQLINGSYFSALKMPTLWRGKVQIIEGAGHALQWEQPEKFDALIEALEEAATEVEESQGERLH